MNVDPSVNGEEGLFFQPSPLCLIGVLLNRPVEVVSKLGDEKNAPLLEKSAPVVIGLDSRDLEFVSPPLLRFKDISLILFILS